MTCSRRISFLIDSLSDYSTTVSHGYVELFESINIKKTLNCSIIKESCNVSENVDSPIFTVDSLLCLVFVPAHMIPTELLQYFGCNLCLISSLRILRHVAEPSKYLALIKPQSAEAGNRLIEEYNGQILSSFDKSTCMLYRAVGVSDLRVLSPHQPIKGIIVDDIQEDPDTCPVCLETIPTTNPMSIITCCNHRFHMQCMARLESSQCPVCRFEHDGEIGTISECFACGTHVLSPANPVAVPQADLWLCLICGFTGCGVSHGAHIQRHYEETLHTYAQNIESRHVWDFAGDGYVHRLILNNPDNTDEESNHLSSAKLVEASNPHSLSGLRDSRAPLSTDQEEHVVNNKLEAAARHYNSLLAWQLEQNRLLYEARLQKIRESVIHLSNSGKGQTNISGISKGKGHLTVSGGRGDMQNNVGKLIKAGGDVASANWRENMITSLRTEKHKALKLVEGARERLERAHKEASILRDLNVSLRQNQEEWQRRVEVAVDTMREAEKAATWEIPLLEEKVRVLMEKLDISSKTTGPRGADGNEGPQQQGSPITHPDST